MRIIQITIFLIFATSMSLFADVFDMVVDASGNGNYTTIQAAFNAVPDNSDERTLIFVRAGTYTEKVVLGANKNNVSLIGEDVDTVVLSWNDHAGSATGLSSANTYTFMVEGSDFYMQNVTVQNTAGNIGQALAIRTVGDRGVYNNCKFLGFQDTYYAHKNRQYNYNCYVEGATDFIYGDATAVFDNCTVNCMKGGQYITAPSDTKLFTQFTSGNVFYHGLMIINSDVTADDDVPANSYYLGRPWQPRASSVYIYCRLGNHVKPQGWSTWNDDNHLSGFYGEYQNTDFEGNPIDFSQRVEWSSQITDARIQNFYKYSFFFKKNGEEWDSEKVTKALLTPENIHADGSKILWNAVENALGYVVYINGSLFAITSQSYADAPGVDAAEVSVKSVRDNGVMSNEENSNLLTFVNDYNSYNGFAISIAGNIISAHEAFTLSVFDTGGHLVYYAPLSKEHKVEDLNSSTYILKAENTKGEISIHKCMFKIY
ncbi:MAG: pectinesterase family protein [Prolixibacteraceae bacterium]|jgi:pectin methylesterase-like acyl-CoA thioesterase|nr:pectinesterase family protein [Prolixibacteraceae bacterium]